MNLESNLFDLMFDSIVILFSLLKILLDVLEVAFELLTAFFELFFNQVYPANFIVWVVVATILNLLDGINELVVE